MGFCVHRGIDNLSEITTDVPDTFGVAPTACLSSLREEGGIRKRGSVAGDPIEVQPGCLGCRVFQTWPHWVDPRVRFQPHGLSF